MFSTSKHFVFILNPALKLCGNDSCVFYWNFPYSFYLVLFSFQHAEESDARPCSELDFYNGPMTRHKQQLLQEQEMLLEQVQKNHLERNGSKETNNSTKAFSDSSSPTNSSVTSTTPNSLNDSMFQMTSLERSMENDASNSYGSKPLHSFKPYKERHPRKDFSSTMKCDNVFSRENQALDGFVFGIPHVRHVIFIYA